MWYRAMMVCASLVALACSPEDDPPAQGGTEDSTGDLTSSSTAAPGTSVDSTAATNGVATQEPTGESSDGTSGSSTADAASTVTSSTTSATTTTGIVGNGGSFEWRVNEAGPQEYGHQLELPPTFGAAEFSLQLWIRPDESFPVGSTAGDGIRTNWSDTDEMPYSSGQWWYRGNFLLDGHNNTSGFSQGTFSLQFYGGGRLRWLFGDESNVSGGVRSAGAFPAADTPSLLDGNWHQVTVVRRWAGEQDADLELWIDGALIDVETTNLRTNMRSFWDDWDGFGGAQDGWFWGAEKQAALEKLAAYEDYKGLMAEVRFWDRALSVDELEAEFNAAVTGDEQGLVGYYPWSQRGDTDVCDAVTTSCATLYRTDDTQWVAVGPPLQR